MQFYYSIKNIFKGIGGSFEQVLLIGTKKDTPAVAVRFDEARGAIKGIRSRSQKFRVFVLSSNAYPHLTSKHSTLRILLKK